MGVVDGLLAMRDIPRRLRNQFMRGRFGQRVMAPFGRELAPERWIFVVGCYNSGTTLLKEMLGYVGINPDRLLVEWVSASEGKRFQTLVTEFVERVRELGPSEGGRHLPD